MVFVKLTPRASRLLKKIDQPEQELHRQLLGHLTRKELKELSRLLVKARQSLVD